MPRAFAPIDLPALRDYRRTQSPQRARRLSALSLMFVTAELLSGCSPEPAASQAKPSTSLAIVPYEVELRSNDVIVEAVGTARAQQTAVIYAETGGEVVAMPFEAGERVEKSDTIVQLEAREERLAVRRAKIAVKDAEQRLDRYQRIDVPGAISASQIDEGKTALDGARVELEIAENALAERTVKAPFSGYLGLSDVDTGSRVTPTTAIAQLDDRSILFVEFEAPEQVFGKIVIGEQVKMTPFSGLRKFYPAEVLALDGSIDPITRAFRVRTKVTNTDDQLRPGMSFRVAFVIEGQDYPSVPEAAIVWGSDGPYLWGVEEGIARRVAITIVARKDGFVLVKADLEAGSQVIARGVQKAREGERITFTASNAGSASNAATGQANPPVQSAR